MTTEQRYTLWEAQRELARRKCATSGHDFDLIRVVNQEGPVAVFCTCCGKTWGVNAERSAEPDGGV